MACDICGKTNCNLNTLLDSYKTDEIAQICNECEGVINRHLGKLKSLTSRILRDLFKRFMRERKLARSGPAGRSTASADAPL